VTAGSLLVDVDCRHPPTSLAGPAVNGVRFDPLRPAELGPRVASFLHCGRSHIVHFFAAHPTVLARQDAEYRSLLNRGDLNLPDGRPVVWALRLLGRRTEQITGTDGFQLLCDWGRAHGIRHFFYGGTPQVLLQLQQHLEQRYPGIEIAGTISPPFRALSDQELREDAARIRASRADLVWVGLGAPKQDVVGERLRELECAPVLLCVGAAFDFLAGVKKRAPRPLRRLGLEWLYRLAIEPRRLWRRYLLGNPQFMVGVARDYLASRAGP
jgi:N-acetylglucosaminyldiphosphoundecaprenol N-acetyl-beta-D-mannosaminyltransferase